jgi:hypothetical protein
MLNLSVQPWLLKEARFVSSMPNDKKALCSTCVPIAVAQKPGEEGHHHSWNLDASPLSVDGLIESTSRSSSFTVQPEYIGGTPTCSRMPIEGSAEIMTSATWK